MSPEMAGMDTLAIDVSSTIMNVAAASAIVPATSLPPVSGARTAGAAGGVPRDGDVAMLLKLMFP
jgi:hypothetical protein